MSIKHYKALMRRIQMQPRTFRMLGRLTVIHRHSIVSTTKWPTQRIQGQPISVGCGMTSQTTKMTNQLVCAETAMTMRGRQSNYTYFYCFILDYLQCYAT